jgi:hypothetical protein
MFLQAWLTKHVKSVQAAFKAAGAGSKAKQQQHHQPPHDGDSAGGEAATTNVKRSAAAASGGHPFSTPKLLTVPRAAACLGLSLTSDPSDPAVSSDDSSSKLVSFLLGALGDATATTVGSALAAGLQASIMLYLDVHY